MTGLSRSIKFRINPTNSAMFRAVFGHTRGKIKKNTQHESCRVIFHLQLFCWTIFEENALQVSGSELLSFDSMQTAMFRALFE